MEDGRYEVSLPWLDNHLPLPTNRQLAEKRLKSTIKSLEQKQSLEGYQNVFKEWLEEDIIEPVEISKLDDHDCHYLPHRAVFKENSTTRIRPVFDASAKEKGSISLNDCLQKGPNYIESIPGILNRFRLGKFGVIADIRKAFLQIELDPEDRKYLRFLWHEDGDSEKLRIFQHKRVVFGVTCSPFLLGATIKYHIEQVPEHLRPTAEKLKVSMYVDNCVTSLEQKSDLEEFIENSKEIFSSAKFDLRGWQFNQEFSDNSPSAHTEESEEIVSVLGLR